MVSFLYNLMVKLFLYNFKKLIILSIIHIRIDLYIYVFIIQYIKLMFYTPENISPLKPSVIICRKEKFQYIRDLYFHVKYTYAVYLVHKVLISDTYNKTFIMTS